MNILCTTSVLWNHHPAYNGSTFAFKQTARVYAILLYILLDSLEGGPGVQAYSLLSLGRS